MSDILFQRDDYVFSYRVAGILVHENRILLQKPTNDTGYAIPGGHVGLGETNAQTLEAEDFITFQRKMNWKEDSINLLERSLRNTIHSISAVLDGELIGMGRLIGDGALY